MKSKANFKSVKKSQSAKKAESKLSFWQNLYQMRRDFLGRRPHRSFCLSRRQQFRRPLEIKGYIAFSLDVWRQLKRGRRFFFRLFLLSFVIFVALSLLMSQSAYNNLRSALNLSMKEAGFVNGLYKASLLVFSSFSFGASDLAGFGQTQVVLSGLVFILIWLVTVYFLRHQLADKTVNLKTAVYNCFAPFPATVLLLFLAILQAVPFALYAIVYSAARQYESLLSGVGGLLAALAGILIFALVLYWLVSTLIALVLVTIQGTTPFQAWRVADDMVTGRRGKIVRRVLWHLLQVFMLLVVTLIPLAMIENVLAEKWDFITKLPIMPVVFVFQSILVAIWSSAYVYMLYRKILDDKSQPA